MPHLLIRGISPERVREASRPLVSELAGICACPPDYFMLECLTTTAAADGEFAASFPFVEVAWFDRGPAVQDRFAAAVDRHLRESYGLPELEIAFRAYRERDYYANGKSLGAGEEGVDASDPDGGKGEKARTEPDVMNVESESASPADSAALRKLEEEVATLRAANRKLAEELRKARKPSSAGTDAMSTRLRDALRE